MQLFGTEYSVCINRSWFWKQAFCDVMKGNYTVQQCHLGVLATVFEFAERLNVAPVLAGS